MTVGKDRRLINERVSDEISSRITTIAIGLRHSARADSVRASGEASGDERPDRGGDVWVTYAGVQMTPGDTLLGGCEHKHTGSCSPDGVYLYVRCMDCWKLLAMSDEGARRLDDCPGYEPAKKCYGRDCVHCGFDWWDHRHADPDAAKEIERLRAALAESCAEERSQIWEAGPGGGCARALAAEAIIDRIDRRMGVAWTRKLADALTPNAALTGAPAAPQPPDAAGGASG